MSDDEKTKKDLAGMTLFSGVDSAAIAVLAGAATKVFVGKGDFVVREGTPGRELYLVKRGHMVVVKGAGSSGEMILATIGAGEFFGEMSILESATRSASVRCLEPGVLYRLTSDELLGLLKPRPDQFLVLMSNIARHLSRRLRATDESFAASVV